MSNDTKNNNETKVHVEENEKHLLLDHSYDGIHELNNPLPSWWQFTFYGAIVFAIFYFIFYQILGGPTLRDEFKADFAKVEATRAADAKKNGAFDAAVYETHLKNDGVKKGEAIFLANCIPCHKEKAIGDIGPNLTDEYWLRAKGTPPTVFFLVFNGSVANGMPVWSETLSKEDIYDVVTYVQSLHNTHQAGGKAPQGDKVDDAGNVIAGGAAVATGTTEPVAAPAEAPAAAPAEAPAAAPATK
jgi:cytochrome c oxidase cbb3-type subunit 3